MGTWEGWRSAAEGCLIGRGLRPVTVTVAVAGRNPPSGRNRGRSDSIWSNYSYSDSYTLQSQEVTNER